MSEKIIEKLLEYLQGTEDFILEHAPDTIMQIFKYEKISTIYQIAILFILVISLSISGIYFYKNPYLDKYGHRELPSILIPMFCGIGCPILFLQLCIFTDKLIKIYVAPKYFLLQMVLNLKA